MSDSETQLETSKMMIDYDSHPTDLGVEGGVSISRAPSRNSLVTKDSMLTPISAFKSCVELFLHIALSLPTPNHSTIFLKTSSLPAPLLGLPINSFQ